MIFLPGFFLFIVSVVLLCMGGKTSKIVGVFILTALVALVIRDLQRGFKMEWNPRLEASQVMGKYRDGREEITLASDRTYTYDNGDGKSSGTWTLDDFNLHFTDGETSKTRRLRFVQWDGVNYIMVNEPEDIDGWDGSLGLKQQGIR